MKAAIPLLILAGSFVVGCANEAPRRQTAIPQPPRSEMATIAAAPGTIARPAPSAEQLPLVAVVRADWCPACRRLEPVVKQLEAELKGRARFVYLDLTSDDTSAHAARLAAELGIDGFYEANGGSTGVVAVFGRDHASPVRVRGLEPEAYRQAIAAAAGSFSADRAARPE